MNRNAMRAELRRLRSQNKSLRERNEVLAQENYFLRHSSGYPCATEKVSMDIKEFRTKFSFDYPFLYSESFMEEGALRYFLNDFNKYLVGSGMIHQEIKENVIESRLRFCLLPVKE